MNSKHVQDLKNVLGMLFNLRSDKFTLILPSEILAFYVRVFTNRPILHFKSWEVNIKQNPIYWLKSG